MNRFITMGRVASLAATVALIVPSHVVAAQPAPNHATKFEPVRPVDVALDGQRGFSGQVLNVEGRPVAGTTVTLYQGKQQWQTITDADGQYRVADLQGGAYVARVGDQLKQVRAWAPNTAPPGANRGLLMIDGNQLIRGQAYCGNPVACGSPVAAGFAGMKEALSHPLVIGGIIAAAIAIPIAIHNSNDDDPPAS
ncbi:carboxypeptidase-like regulatory domain-containing protein [Pirellulales bacterium]|nr:carboxypeptidase-like regulatory domain-containing protein [Pirellulales bacterium]